MFHKLLQKIYRDADDEGEEYSEEVATHLAKVFAQLLTSVSILHNDMVFAFACWRSRRLRFLIGCICVRRSRRLRFLI